MNSRRGKSSFGARTILLTFLFSPAHAQDRSGKETKLWELGPDVDHIVFPVDLEFPEVSTNTNTRHDVPVEEKKQTDTPRYAEEPEEPEATPEEIEADQRKLREMLARHGDVLTMLKEAAVDLGLIESRIGEARVNDVLFDAKMDYFFENFKNEPSIDTPYILFASFSREQAEKAIEIARSRANEDYSDFVQVLRALPTYRGVAEHLFQLAKTPIGPGRKIANSVLLAMSKLSQIGDKRVLPFIRKEWEVASQYGLNSDRRLLATIGARLGDAFFLQKILDNFSQEGRSANAAILAKNRTSAANELFFGYIKNQIKNEKGQEVDESERYFISEAHGVSVALRYFGNPRDRDLLDELAKLLLQHAEVPPKSGWQWGFASHQVEKLIRLLNGANTTHTDRLLEAMALPGFFGETSSRLRDKEMRIAYERMGHRAARPTILNWLAKKQSESDPDTYDYVFDYVVDQAAQFQKSQRMRVCSPIQNKYILDIYTTNNLELVLGRPAILGFEGHAVVEDDYLGEIVFSDVDIENQKVQGKNIVLESDDGDFLHLQHFLSDGSIAELQAAVVLTRKTAARLVNELDYAETQGFDLMQPSVEVQSFQFDLNRDPISRALSGVIGLRTSLGDIGVRMHEVTAEEGETRDSCESDKIVSGSRIEADQNAGGRVGISAGSGKSGS